MLTPSFPYHPDYGLPDDLRLEILRFAALNGVRATALTYNVHPSTIYKWRKDLDHVRS